MSRLWMKILVFGSLMGAAGVIWGILESAFLTGHYLITGLDAPESQAAWAMPVSLVILSFSLWLAAKLVLGDALRGMVALAAYPPFILFYVIVPAAFLCIVASPGLDVMLYTGIGFIALSIAVAVAFALQVRREKRAGRTYKQPFPKALVATTLAIWALGSVLLRFAFPQGTDAAGLAWFEAVGGFSIPMAWQLGTVALVDFGRWLGYSVLVGGVLGLWMGTFLAIHTDRPASAWTALRSALICLIIGAVLSGLMFGAHAVLLLQMYRVAWNADAMLATSLWVWGILGAVSGLMLACAVHVLSAQPTERMSRLPTALALIIPPVVVASVWAIGFVRALDEGRSLLAKAEKLEGQARWVNIGTGADTEPTLTRGDLVIHIRSSGNMERSYQRHSYRHTIKLCDELLERYQNSAYRSAALYLKYRSETYDWQPRKALRMLAALDSQYPRHGYYESTGGHLLLYDLVLTGDYERVVRLSREHSRGWPDYDPSEMEAYAAGVLGLWDEVIRCYQGEVARLEADTKYKSKSYYKELDEYRSRIKDAQEKKAKGVGARTRADVEGGVLLAGRPLSSCKVCVVPVGWKSPVEDVYDAASRGGLVGITDDSGVYRIRGVPSGSYEIILILDSQNVAAECSIRAPGVPYSVVGASTRLPDILLTPQEDRER